MLTKDLVACRISGKRIIPQFVRVDNPALLELAARMCNAFKANGTLTRSDCEETLEQLGQSCDDARLAAGLRKLFLDRAVFSVCNQVDYPAERRRLFLASAQTLRSGAYPAETAFRAQVDASVFRSPLTAGGSGGSSAGSGSGNDGSGSSSGIYADLPENDRLVSLRETGPRELLERYNCGLVQALLLFADRLVVVLEEATPALLRRLISQVRFRRLVAVISRCAPNGRPAKSLAFEPEDVKNRGTLCVRLDIDGPGSILKQSRSYGLQLALFFTAVCSMRRWRIVADVHWKNAPRRLELDETSGVVCREQPGAYVPEEVVAFAEHFKQNAPGWKINGKCPFLKGEHGLLVFPDFRFTSPKGNIVYLELFHRWHRNQLFQRLDALDNGTDWPLAIGVDRAVAQHPDVSKRLETSPYFARAGFLYRDFPTVDRVLKCLSKI